MDRNVRTVDDVFALLDALFTTGSEAGRPATGDGRDFWDRLYGDRSRPVPFFPAKPDENLAAYVEQGLISPCRVLDLGCGPGRNALYLASNGFEVDAVDLSPVAVTWAEDRAREAGVDVRFVCGDAFALPAGELNGPYDLVVDSGCFHHLPPHRRVSYLAFLDRVLVPGGHLALTCFAAGEKGMGSELPDADLYRARSLQGGLAYTPESLRWIFSDLAEVELRRMREQPPESALFGVAFLWAALFRRRPSSRSATRRSTRD
ncbi:class I SAM-dependent methyltransferase [Actinacidiphila paucisporea]|uniref:Methyltransferase domain-containing protein n=1 Tax=Actinacidiphila paucisporea TaxID=310782 RepID=A0A1M6YNL8_9ACTN|nr:class I SAM-dependent methyltransferase [Actinacidiphila paucisporea]SHL19838.1 Methyltransferase domain-containing protein [Actinacidiphila paucisporea]